MRAPNLFLERSRQLPPDSLDKAASDGRRWPGAPSVSMSRSYWGDIKSNHKEVVRATQSQLMAYRVRGNRMLPEPKPETQHGKAVPRAGPHLGISPPADQHSVGRQAALSPGGPVHGYEGSQAHPHWLGAPQPRSPSRVGGSPTRGQAAEPCAVQKLQPAAAGHFRGGKRGACTPFPGRSFLHWPGGRQFSSPVTRELKGQ